MVGIHSEAFGADKGEDSSAYDGFGNSDDEESEDVEDDHAEEASLWLALPEHRKKGGGGSQQKIHFLQGFAIRFSQIVVSGVFASVLCKSIEILSFCKFFANMILQALAHSSKYSFTVF